MATRMYRWSARWGGLSVSRKAAWIVSTLVVVVAVIGAAFAFGVVVYEPSHHEGPVGVTIKAPESGPKAIAGQR
jgi:hypothetical protein